jgi:hypothetical protein
MEKGARRYMLLNERVDILFHVGFHKTASTWLQAGFFTEHPDLGLLNNYTAPWDDPITASLVRNSAYE